MRDAFGVAWERNREENERTVAKYGWNNVVKLENAMMLQYQLMAAAQPPAAPMTPPVSQVEELEGQLKGALAEIAALKAANARLQIGCATKPETGSGTKRAEAHAAGTALRYKTPFDKIAKNAARQKALAAT